MGQLWVWVPFPLHRGNLNDTSPKRTIKAFTLSSVNAFQSGQPHVQGILPQVDKTHSIFVMILVFPNEISTNYHSIFNNSKGWIPA